MFRPLQLTTKRKNSFSYAVREKNPENVNRGSIYRLKAIAGGIYFNQMQFRMYETNQKYAIHLSTLFNRLESKYVLLICDFLVASTTNQMI